MKEAELERRLRRAAVDMPGPEPELASRIMASLDAAREAPSPSPQIAIRPRSLIASGLAMAACLLIWLTWQSPSDPRDPGASATTGPGILAAVPDLSLDEATRLSSSQLHAWVDGPLLREVENWVDLGARAVRRCSSLVPPPMRATITREG